MAEDIKKVQQEVTVAEAIDNEKSVDAVVPANVPLEEPTAVNNNEGVPENYTLPIKLDKVEEQIKEVLNYDGAILCEIMTETEYSFTPKLSSRKLEDGTMISATLEDMSPFLPREEFNENMLK